MAPISDPPKRDGRIAGLFKQKGIWQTLEFLFWRTLCPYPDQTKIGMWWYAKSGSVAAYFHAKHCAQCRERRQHP